MKANEAPEKCMTFYHGTSKENWDAIQKEGILYGRRYITDNNGNIIKEADRCTYLATDLEEAKCYGDVILQVEYDPFKHKNENNYIDGCWQVRVYEPIPISKIQEIKSMKANEALEKIKNSLRKKFRIVKNDLACPEAFHPLWYRIEQMHTILFFFHWWDTPEFEPPHNFENDCDAMKCIKAHYPNAIVYDYYSENKCER